MFATALTLNVLPLHGMEHYDTLCPYPPGKDSKERRSSMRAEKQDVLKRLNYIEGHIGGIRKMVEEDKYCVDILRQTYAVRKAIEKLEALILENHLETCVPEGIRDGREEAVIAELVQLYNLAGNR
jgi:CsoR family transcriptional regulator, copper-sensing transcriptional repressor